MVDVGVRNNNGFDIREGTEKMLPLLTERRGEMVAQNQGIRAKKGKSAAQLLSTLLHKADEGAIGKLIVEAVILLSASKRVDGSKVLRGAARRIGWTTMPSPLESSRSSQQKRSRRKLRST
jgi:ParB family chromosome partitioning protein